jgi:membrane associated rhomboid family serine protease
MDDLIFYPPAVSKQGQWYRFITCGLIHADFGHVFFNMFSLYLFGRFVEAEFNNIFGDLGKWIYLILYVTALVASLLPTYFENKDNYYYRGLGASGAVSAIIFAGLLIAPYLEVYMFFIPLPIPGFIFAPLYLLVSVWFEKKGNSNINHSAHIWGALYGLAFTIVAGYAVGFNVILNFIRGVQMYLASKGWM